MKRVVWDESIRVGDWVCNKLQCAFDSKTCTAIGLERDGELIGGVVFDHYNVQSIAMHVASSEENWLTRDFLRAVFGYPFGQLGVKKIIGLVDSNNHQARKFDENIGFQLEAVIKDAGRTGDLLIYSMTLQQCRFLGERYGKRFSAVSS